MQVQTNLNLQVATHHNSLASPGTYLGGSSEMLSPTVTAQQPITPSDGQNKVHFEFPPDLLAPHGYRHPPITSTMPPAILNPRNSVPKEANENQAPTMTPVQLEPYQAIPAPLHTQLISVSDPALTQMPFKTDIHTLGTGSTRSIRSAAESSDSSTSAPVNIRLPFSQLTSSINTLSMTHHPKRAHYKQVRKQARVVATAGGMVVGGLTLGPAGIVIGAGVGMATNKYCKRKDKKAQQKHEQRSFQQAANDSIVARHQGAFC